jgi:hypothetical protein
MNTDRLLGDLIPLICAISYFLLIRGIVKLPPERQVKFDEFMARRRYLMLSITYGLMVVSVAFIVKDAFFS